MNLRNTLALSPLGLAVAASSASLRGANNPGDLGAFDDTLQRRELDNRIIGGSEALVDRYTYAVSLQDSVAHFCGGSMLAPDIVLSAAHCAQQSAYDVAIHRHNLRDDGDGEVRRVVTQVRHPEYDPNKVNNDFMILKLDEPTSEPVDFVEVGPEYVDGDDAVTIVGWGDTDPTEGTALPPRLMETEVFTLTNDECRASEGTVQGTNWFGQVFATTEAYGDRITDNMICAKDEGEDSCQGDSGGPMIIKSDAGDRQVGVVSWGFGCAHDDFPGVYARVSAQYEWIRDTVCALSAAPPAYMECPPQAAGVEATAGTTVNTNDEGWTTLLTENFDVGLGLFDRAENADATYYPTANERQGVVGIGNEEALLSNKLTFAPDGTNTLYRIRFSFYAMNMGNTDDLCLTYSVNDGSVVGEKCWRGGDAFENEAWYDDRSLVFSKPSGASSLTLQFAVKGDSSEDKVLIDSVRILGQ